MRVAVRFGLSVAYYVAGRLRECLAVAEQGLGLARGDLDLSADRIRFSPSLGLSCWHALVRETGARGFEPHVYLERAELARLLGDDAARQRELREAHRSFTEMGATIRAAEVARELA